MPGRDLPRTIVPFAVMISLQACAVVIGTWLAGKTWATHGRFGSDIVVHPIAPMIMVEWEELALGLILACFLLPVVSGISGMFVRGPTVVVAAVSVSFVYVLTTYTMLAGTFVGGWDYLDWRPISVVRLIRWLVLPDFGILAPTHANALPWPIPFLILMTALSGGFALVGRRIGISVGGLFRHGAGLG